MRFKTYNLNKIISNSFDSSIIIICYKWKKEDNSKVLFQIFENKTEMEGVLYVLTCQNVKVEKYDQVVGGRGGGKKQKHIAENISHV